MTRPHPVMACAECGPVITEAVSRCPLCGSYKVSWCDLAAGLEHFAKLVEDHEYGGPIDLFRAAAKLIRAQQAEIEALKPDGGAKRRRQELKARRLAEVIEDWTGAKIFWRHIPVSPEGLLSMPNTLWEALTDEVNDRYRSYHKPPSDKTKAFVAEMFAGPQEPVDV